MTGGFGELGAALAVFFASHSLPSVGPVRRRCVAAVGERGFLLGYSLISAGVTIWLIAAALAAPPYELWPMTVVGMWVTAISMIFAAVFLVWGLTTPNALSIRIRAGAFDPARPGLIAVTRHPILWSFVFWGLGHLASNGDAGTAILFGLLGGFGLLGTFILDARRRRELGDATWRQMTWQTSSVPFASILNGRAAMPWRALGAWPTWLGLALYVGALALHHSVIGVSPLPPF
ncbi:MAG: NnrU family protein [Rhodospirillaceae bacterium]|nr:NnrU family protein [Rhodospirillaceae bacterium]